MQLVIYIVVGLVGIWGLYSGYLWLTSQSLKGREITPLRHKAPELGDLPEKAIVYCYSPNCGPCRNMTPLVDELQQDGEPIVKLDIPQHLELAHELGIKATPTLLLVKQGRVEEVIVGTRTPTQIRQMLA